MTSYRDIPLDLVVPSDNNVRHTFDPATDEDDATLLDSMRVGTLLQPIRVRPHPQNPGHFEIIAGERRYLAAKYLLHATIPAVVDDTCSELEARRQRFAENAARKNLSAYLHCRALADCVEIERTENPDITIQQLADRMGMTFGSMSRCDSVWRSLTAETHAEIARTDMAGRINWDHLNTMARVKDPEGQLRVLARIVRTLSASPSTPGDTRRKTGSRPKKLPAIYRRVIDVDMGDAPNAPRAPHVRLRPTRSAGKPEFTLAIGCAPQDLDPSAVPALMAALRTQSEAALRAVELKIREEKSQHEEGGARA